MFLIVLALFIGLTAISIVCAGTLSLLRNSEQSVNKWFFWFAIATGLWIVANFVDSNFIFRLFTTPLIKLDYSVALFLIWLFMGFSAALTASNRSHKPVDVVRTVHKNSVASALIINGMVVVGVWSNLFFTVSVSTSSMHTTLKPLLCVYVLLIFIYFLHALRLLSAGYKKTAYGKREGLDLIWAGFFAAVILNVLTNIVFPAFIDSRTTLRALNVLGYLGVGVLVGAIYFAITSKKLFDIRSAVTKSLAYILVLGLVGVVYATAVSFASILLSGTRANTALLVSNVFFTFAAAITFPYLKQLVAKWTNDVFFHDSYDAGKVLATLASITSSSLDLNKILSKTERLFIQEVKVGFCHFLIMSESNAKIYGQHTEPMLTKGADQIKKAVRSAMPVIVPELHTDSKAFELLHTADVELVVPLYANSTLLGYLLMGPKNNGSAYIKRDIQLFSTAANTLAVALQNALRFEEIENFNATLQERVVEATRKLRHTNEKLKALDETKDDFISMASHQLRTPLTSVKGYLSMVLEGDAGKLTPMQKEMLGQAFFSSQRMVYLIADLLNVSRLKTGKFIIEPTVVNLVKLVNEELDQLKETAASRSLSLKFEHPETFPDLMLDETKTRQIIMNFVDNAIYYTPAGGEITVQLAETPTSVELRVIDNGIGVPKGEQHHLFNKFYRAGNARKARPDGTGLGLFMAKKVIVGQGGAVLFESQEGKGSTFGFVFSKSKLQVSAPATPVVGAPEPVKT